MLLESGWGASTRCHVSWIVLRVHVVPFPMGKLLDGCYSVRDERCPRGRRLGDPGKGDLGIASVEALILGELQFQILDTVLH